ncbi:sigma factor-like helix-turn-helix DNA-binding protein [Streptomyces mirabilis]|uniref:sigma factor-like helix-turn-helix DNA-binding protein n=1 Tax=Streptomyces mirabilis TaxID=68239 RepID=UPI00365A723B
MMETLTPTQRAVYLLREGIGCPYVRISELLHMSFAHARRQVSRAQQRLVGRRRRQPVDSVAYRRLVQAFFAAARSGEFGHLARVLAADGGQPLPCNAARQLT